MHRAVRRTLAIAGVAGLLVLTPATAYAEDAPPAPDQGTEQSSGNLDDPPASGCEENPEICESSGPMAPPSDVDCSLPPNEPDEGVAVGEPNPNAPSSDTGTATIAAAEEEPTDEQMFCIASTGGLPQADTTSGGGQPVPEAAPGELPRTGPAPVVPTAVVGTSLVLLGFGLAHAGRRRVAAV